MARGVGDDDPRQIVYTRLSISSVQMQLVGVARDAADTFGALDRRQVNWRPDATRWSVARCFDHLLTANQLMRVAADEAVAAR